MTVIEGIKTSVPLHLQILDDPDFRPGRLGTAFMDRFMPRPSAKKRLASLKPPDAWGRGPCSHGAAFPLRPSSTSSGRSRRMGDSGPRARVPRWRRHPVQLRAKQAPSGRLLELVRHRSSRWPDRTAPA